MTWKNWALSQTECAFHPGQLYGNMVADAEESIEENPEEDE